MPTSRVSGDTPSVSSNDFLVSLVVCTLQRPDFLQRLFVSLSEQTYRRFEVILIVQGDPSSTLKVADAWRGVLDLTVVTSEIGLSRGRNAGLSHVRGDIVGFPDDDCRYDRDFLSILTSAFARLPEASALTGRTVDQNGSDSLGRYLGYDAAITRDNIWLAGNSNSMFFRAEVVRRVGGFDETLGVGSGTIFQSGEETDFLLRALNLGVTGYFLREIVVRHDQIDTRDPDIVRRAQRYAPGFGRVLRQHQFGLGVLLGRLTRTAIGGLLAAMRGDGQSCRYKLSWISGTLRGYFAPASSARRLSQATSGRPVRDPVGSAEPIRPDPFSEVK